MKPPSIALDIFEQIDQAEARFTEREPQILAFLDEADRFDRLRREAVSLLHRFPGPESRPPLFGMLAGVKDIFQVEGFVTRAGCRLPPEVLQGREAESVSRLKKAGALILGKTVTTEFAYFTPGPTRNPHNLEHTPGGSSSGSAAAVAAGLCDLALGTQTIGSIIRPAAFCGAVGLKPSYDRISREGVIPLSPSLDHVGFFALDVSSAQRVAPVLYEDWKGVATAPWKPTLGIPEGSYLASASDLALTCFDTICKTLADTGYELRRVPIMSNFDEVCARHDLIMSAEAARAHKAWFENYENLYSSKFIELIRRGQAVTDAQLQSALAARDNFRSELRQTMTEHDIDLWICPSAVGPAPRGLESTGDPVMNLPWTQAGLPTLNLPSGKSQDGLPMGLQVVGDWYEDESLLGWAEDLEKALANL